MSAFVLPSSRRSLARSIPSINRTTSHRVRQIPRLLSTVRQSQCIVTKPASISALRAFHISASTRKGLAPDSEDPQPKESEAHEDITAPTYLQIDDYHRLSDEFLDSLSRKLEAKYEEGEQLDVEFSQGVLTITSSQGTYVLNKQPANKQIWLSSPISGPKRYDWVVTGESMQHKEGSGSGDWVYLKDGTNLPALLRNELKVDMSEDPPEIS